jgi:YHS domain-containing protein
MPKDVICGAEVDRNTPFKLECEGLTRYFCSQECLDEFLEEQDVVPGDTEEDVRAGG